MSYITEACYHDEKLLNHERLNYWKSIIVGYNILEQLYHKGLGQPNFLVSILEIIVVNNQLHVLKHHWMKFSRCIRNNYQDILKFVPAK